MEAKVAREKVRRFLVWIETGTERRDQVIELNPNATDLEVARALNDATDDLIAEYVDSGSHELDDEEEQPS